MRLGRLELGRLIEEDRKSDSASLARGIRIDLVIALCALLVSSLATAASWWQTRVIQQQLSAQVWPYVSISEGFSGDSVQILIENNGLGPAVLRSAAITLDGKPVSNAVALMHAILGPNIMARRPHGEKIGLTLNSATSGAVLRVGEPTVIFALRSKTFARRFMHAFPRLETRICYCAIIPGTCWLNDANERGDPQALPACREMPDDLLHSSNDGSLDALGGKF